jgi:hypothetical protein
MTCPIARAQQAAAHACAGPPGPQVTAAMGPRGVVGLARARASVAARDVPVTEQGSGGHAARQRPAAHPAGYKSRLLHWPGRRWDFGLPSRRPVGGKLAAVVPAWFTATCVLSIVTLAAGVLRTCVRPLACRPARRSGWSAWARRQHRDTGVARLQPGVRSLAEAARRSRNRERDPTLQRPPGMPCGCGPGGLVSLQSRACWMMPRSKRVTFVGDVRDAALSRGGVSRRCLWIRAGSSRGHRSRCVLTRPGLTMPRTGACAPGPTLITNSVIRCSVACTTTATGGWRRPTASTSFW